ncbi:hypothetical protein B0T17DRAFT_524518, partial [Bombardia bombarda]
MEVPKCPPRIPLFAQHQLLFSGSCWLFRISHRLVVHVYADDGGHDDNVGQVSTLD